MLKAATALALVLLATPAAAAALTPAQQAEIEAAIAGGPNSDAAMYARAHNVPLAEAIRRLEIQQRDSVGPLTEPGPPPPPPPDSIGAVQRAVGAKEEATFAGLWIQHEPTYGVVVAFTRDAARTLAKYTKDPLFIPLERPGPTWRELLDTQERLVTQLQRYGVRGMGASSNVRTGRVEIEIWSGEEELKAALERGDIKLPPYVDIAWPQPPKYAAPPPPPVGYVNPLKAFPRFKHRSGGIMTLELRTGRVILGEDGCLRLEGERQSPVIVWPNEAALDLSHGDVRIFHRLTGVTIRPGETIALGGSSHMLKDAADVIDQNPACPGPYMYFTGFSSYAPIEEQMLRNEAEERARDEKITVAEARRRIAIERARDETLRAFGARLLAEAPEAYAGIETHRGQARLLIVQGAAVPPIPADLAPYIAIERRPRPLAQLNAARERFVAEAEALGIPAGAYVDTERGAVTIQTDDMLALSRASVEGRIAMPPHAVIYGPGAMPAGYPGEHNMEAAWRVLEAAPDFAEMRALIEAVPQSLYGDAPQKLSRASSLDIARWLVMSGFTAKEIGALRAVGVDPVAAWVEQNGRATPANQAVLADQVVVAELVSIDPNGRSLNDGARSTLRFRVAETLKGSAAPGQTVTIRMASGFEPDGTYAHDNMEPPLLPGLPQSLEVGGRYLLYLSRGQYANTARHSGYKPHDPAWYAARGGPFRILPDGTLDAPYAQTAPGTLEDVRRAVAPIQAAFRKAGVQ